MEVSDEFLLENRDWDPVYLSTLVEPDFHDFTDHWKSSIKDNELVNEMERVERYNPITEDISLDDYVLCDALDKIEHE